MRKWPPTHVQRGGLTKTQTTPEGRLHSERRAINRTWSQVTWPLLVGDTATTLKLTLALWQPFQCMDKNVLLGSSPSTSQSPLILVWPKTQVMCRPSPVWIVNLDPAASAKSRANKLVLHRHTALMLQPATGFSSCFRYQFQTCIMSTLVWKASAVKSWKVCYSSRIYFCRRKSQKSDRTQDLLLLSWIGDWPGKQLEKNYILRILSYFWWHNQEIGWQWLFEATGREN